MTKEKKIAIVIIAIVLLIVGSVTAHMIWRNHIYTQATLRLENGDYEQAEELFLKLHDYKDSHDMVQETLYRKAIYKKENRKFEESISLFQSVQDYKDSKDLMKETIYLFGIDAFEKKDYDKAIEQFEKVIPYKDTSDRRVESYYQRGLLRMENQNFADAATDFKEIGEYKDAKEQLIEANYQNALSSMEKGDYTQAITLFEKIDNYRDAKEQIKESNYQIAVKMLDDNAGKAREKLIELGNYKDVKSLLKNFKYVLIKEEGANSLGKQTITYQYNSKGLLTEKKEKMPNSQKTTVYNYDSNGKLVQEKDDKGTTSYVYYENVEMASKGNETVKTTYNEQGRRKEEIITNADGSYTKITYAYYEHENGKIRCEDKYAFEYTKDGQLYSHWTWGTYYDKKENKERRWIDVYNRNTLERRILYEYFNEYDAKGNLEYVTEYIDGKLSTTDEYKYDDFGNKIYWYRKSTGYESVTNYSYDYIYVSGK